MRLTTTSTVLLGHFQLVNHLAFNTNTTQAWEGKWRVKQIIGPVNLKITDGKQRKVSTASHAAAEEIPLETSRAAEWCPPQIDHLEVPYPMELERRYPQQNKLATPLNLRTSYLYVV